MSDALCWPGKSKLPLRNVCQFYAKQNQNRKSLSFSSFHPSSVPASFWNKRTNKIYDPLRTARLHENEEEKKNRKKCAKKPWIAVGEMKKRAAGRGGCVCEWVSECFGLNDFLHFSHFSNSRKIEAIVNGQNNRQFQGIYYYRMFGMHADRTIWLSAVVGGGDTLNQTTRPAKQLFHHSRIHFGRVYVWHWRPNALP